MQHWPLFLPSRSFFPSCHDKNSLFIFVGLVMISSSGGRSLEKKVQHWLQQCQKMLSAHCVSLTSWRSHDSSTNVFFVRNQMQFAPNDHSSISSGFLLKPFTPTCKIFTNFHSKPLTVPNITTQSLNIEILNYSHFSLLARKKHLYCLRPCPRS